MINYAIKINKSNRYIKYCDDCWYETSAFPLYLFSREQVDRITNQMKKHYQHVFTIIGDDGSKEIINNFAQYCTIKTEEPIKKKIFSFKTSNIKLNK